MKNNLEIILSLLSVNPDKEMSRHDLFAAMEPAEQGAFNVGIDSVSKALTHLEKTGEVIHSGTDYVNKRAVKLWRISDKGLKAISQDNLSIPVEKTEDTEQIQPSIEQPPVPESLALNLMDPMEYALADFIRVLRDIRPAPTINQKQLKIDTLSALSPMFSDDIKAVFAGIVNDLNQLEESLEESA